MKKCSNCGVDNPDVARFCRNCGHPIASQPAAQTSGAAPSGAAASASGAASIPQSPTAEVPTAQIQTPVPTVQASTVPVSTSPTSAQGQQPSPIAAPQSGAPRTQFTPQMAPGRQPTQASQNGYIPLAGQPGYASAGQGSYAPAGQVARSGQSTSTFWQWLLGSFARPSHPAVTQAWWSLVVMLVTAFTAALLNYVWASQTMSAVGSIGNGIANLFNNGSSYSSYSAPAPSGLVLFKDWIAYAILLYAAMLSIFIGRKIMGDPVSFGRIHDQFAQRMVPFAVLCLALTLISLIGGSILAGILFFFTFAIVMLVLPGAMVAEGRNARNLDVFWSWLIAVIVAAVIVFIAFLIFVAIGGSSISTMLHQF